MIERQHEVALCNALDQIYLEGATCIRWDYLYLWFKAQRLNKNAYREINNRWIELCTLTYGHPDSPALEALALEHTLTLRRGTFEGETIVALADWT